METEQITAGWAAGPAAAVARNRSRRAWGLLALLPVSALIVLVVLHVMAASAAAATGGCGGG